VKDILFDLEKTKIRDPKIVGQLAAIINPAKISHNKQQLALKTGRSHYRPKNHRAD